MAEDPEAISTKYSTEAADEAADEAAANDQAAEVDNNPCFSDPESAVTGSPEAATARGSKKKKSKRKRIKKALTGSDAISVEGKGSEARVSGLSNKQVKEILDANPALAQEAKALGPDKAKEMLKDLSVADMLTGLVSYQVKYDCFMDRLTPQFPTDTYWKE